MSFEHEEPPSERAKSPVEDWRARAILGSQLGMAASALPEWLPDVYATLRKQVMHPKYPCFFGTIAERRGEMFYSFVRGKDTGTLPATMETFARLSLQPEYRKHNIAVFFEPDVVPLTHDAYHDLFWDTLQFLHDRDPDPDADRQPDPSQEEWEFSFGGVQMFVVCACPSFGMRHSRNLGPGMVLLFQPRSVFVDTITNKVIGRQARNQVRERLRDWDAVPPHADLGFYGDAGNLEWKQYFLADHDEPAQGACPFLSRRAAKAARPTPAADAEGVTIFCLPYAGGSATLYRDWQARLPASVKLMPLHLPGRGVRSGLQACHTWPALIDTLLNDVRDHIDRPFAFFGHSMGALVAIELAYALRDRYQRTPSWIGVSACHAPSRRERETHWLHCSDAAFIDEVRSLRGMPDELLDNAEFMALVSPYLRADFHLCGTYAYQERAPLQTAMSIFGGRQDTVSGKHEDLAAWSRECAMKPAQHWVEGEHFYINTHRDVLIGQIATDLTQALSVADRGATLRERGSVDRRVNPWMT